LKLAFTVECNANKVKRALFMLRVYGTKFCDAVKTLFYFLVALREPTEKDETNT